MKILPKFVCDVLRTVHESRRRRHTEAAALHFTDEEISLAAALIDSGREWERSSQPYIPEIILSRMAERQIAFDATIAPGME